MTGFVQKSLRRFVRAEAGTTMVELAICLSLFLLILFAVLDFGRLGYNWVMAEKAMQRAVRIAAVRPPICTGVPLYHARLDPNDPTFPAGTNCRDVPGLCAIVNTQCTLSNANGADSEAVAAAAEIWAAVQPLLPDNATNANVLIRYEYDAQLGFLGGPYVPLMTAELVGAATQQGNFGDFMFTFVTPLSALAASAGAADTTGIPVDNGQIPFPDVSVSLPAEDMNLGSRG